MGNKYRETALEIIKKYAKSELPEMVTIDTSVTVFLVGLLLDIAFAIKQAEKLGKQKERKKATSEVCIFCPGLKNGECPNVNSTVISKDEQIRVLSEQIDFMEDQIEELEKQPAPQFDAEKVREMIHNLLKRAFKKGQRFTTTPTGYLIGWADINADLQKLFTTLGIKQ